MSLSAQELTKGKTNAEDSRKLPEKTLGKPIPNHKAQATLSVPVFLSAFVSPDVMLYDLILHQLKLSASDAIQDQ